VPINFVPGDLVLGAFIDSSHHPAALRRVTKRVSKMAARQTAAVSNRQFSCSEHRTKQTGYRIVLNSADCAIPRNHRRRKKAHVGE